MRFCDKLAKLRKNNNFSQEQLADKMNMSRQAISKWESGSSYPDMDKMLQLCKILNCNLDDLMDDGVIGNSDSSKKKFNFNNCFNDFLSFITKSYNMFWSMKFKDKIKLICELLFIGLILYLIGLFVYILIDNLLLDLFWQFDNIGYIIHNFFSNTLILFLISIGFIVFLHLYKIRYLDYYVTVEDSNIREKIIEESIEVQEEKYYQPKNKERIVIRDPKHTSFSFFNFLGILVIGFVKFFLVISFFILLMFFIAVIIIGSISAYHILYNSLFFWLFICILGLMGVFIVALDFIYNFIFNREINFKRNFRISLISIIVFSVGCGLTIVRFMNLNYINTYEDIEMETMTEYIKIDENAIYDFYALDPIYKIDNSLKEAKIDISYIKGFNYEIYSYDRYVGIVAYNDNVFNLYKLIIKDLKMNIVRDYNPDDCCRIEITLNENDYKIMKNY